MRTLSGLILGTVIMLGSATASAAEKTVKLTVENMTCTSCPYIVQKSLKIVDGVTDVQVSFANRTALVTYDDSKVTIEQLTDATFQQGFPSKSAKLGI
jgi:mercuric ion binding protein